MAFLGFGSFPIAVYAFMLTHPVEPLGAGSLQYHIVVSLFAALLPSVLLGVAKVSPALCALPIRCRQHSSRRSRRTLRSSSGCLSGAGCGCTLHWA